jgi:prepilin-type processing-associated H-X9-DG protein
MGSPNAYDATATQEARPSIHFRHRGTVSVAWLDTHVSDEKFAFTSDLADAYYEARSADFNIGWFGPATNELFDLE